MKNIYTFRGQKCKNRLPEPKNEIMMIGNFTCSKKKYTFGGQTGENRPPQPKNGF
jgi:hypothetical protein